MTSIPGSSVNGSQQLQQQAARLAQTEVGVTDPNVASQSASAAVASSGVIGGRNVTTSSTSGSTALASDTTPTGGTAATYGLPAPAGSGEDLVLDLQRLQAAVQSNQLQTSTEDIQGTRQAMADAAAQRMEQLEEQLKKIAESNNSSEIGKIFGWIGAALSLVIGAVLIATGVGVAAGVALLAVGVATIAIMAVQETIGFEKVFEMAASSLKTSLAAIGINITDEQARAAMTVLLAAAALVIGVAVGVVNPAGGIGLFAALIGPILSPQNLTASGLDENVAPWLSLALQGAIAIAAIGVGIGSGVAQAAKATSSTVASAASTASNVGANTTSQVTQTATQAAPAIQRTAQAVQLAAQVGQGAASIGQAGANIAAAAQRYDAAGAEARALEFLSDIFLLQQEFEQQTDRLSKALEEIEETNNIVAGILASNDRVATRVATV